MAEKKGYGQFCPIARAAEILAERWTPLVVRELLCGTVRFNDLQRGVPRMSSSLLSRRLKELEYAGIVERRRAETGPGHEYHITDAGRALLPIIEGMGNWAQRWTRDDLVTDENLDSDLLMWDMRRRVNADNLPAGRRFTIAFQFSGVPSNRSRYWLVFDRGEADLCVKPPGFDVDLYLSCHLRTMTRIWLGHETIDAAVRTEDLRFDGMPRDIEAFRTWFAFSHFVRAGRETPMQTTTRMTG